MPGPPLKKRASDLDVDLLELGTEVPLVPCTLILQRRRAGERPWPFRVYLQQALRAGVPLRSTARASAFFQQRSYYIWAQDARTVLFFCALVGEFCIADVQLVA